jgi:hypothetical protein
MLLLLHEGSFRVPVGNEAAYGVHVSLEPVWPKACKALYDGGLSHLPCTLCGTTMTENTQSTTCYDDICSVLINKFGKERLDGICGRRLRCIGLMRSMPAWHCVACCIACLLWSDCSLLIARQRYRTHSPSSAGISIAVCPHTHSLRGRRWSSRATVAGPIPARCVGRSAPCLRLLTCESRDLAKDVAKIKPLVDGDELHNRRPYVK